MSSTSPDSGTERKVQFLLHTESHGYKQIVEEPSGASITLRWDFNSKYKQ